MNWATEAKRIKPISAILIFAVTAEISLLWHPYVASAFLPGESAGIPTQNKGTVSPAPDSGGLSISEIISLGGGGDCYAERNPQNKGVGNNLWAPCCNCCQKGGSKGFLLEAFDPKTGATLKNGEPSPAGNALGFSHDAVTADNPSGAISQSPTADSLRSAVNQVGSAVKQVQQTVSNIQSGATQAIGEAVAPLGVSPNFGGVVVGNAGRSLIASAFSGNFGNASFAISAGKIAGAAVGSAIGGQTVTDLASAQNAAQIAAGQSLNKFIGGDVNNLINGQDIANAQDLAKTGIFTDVGQQAGLIIGQDVGGALGAILSKNYFALAPTALKLLNNGLPAIGESLGGFGQAVSGAIGSIKGVFDGIGTSVTQGLSDALGPIGQTIGQGLSNLPVVSTVAQLAQGNFSGALGSVASSILSSGLASIQGAAANVLGSLATSVFSPSTLASLTGLSTNALTASITQVPDLANTIIGQTLLGQAGSFLPFVGAAISFAQGNIIGGVGAIASAALTALEIVSGPVGAVIAVISSIFGSLFGSKKCIPVGCLNAVCKSGNAIWDPATGTCGCDQGVALGFADLAGVFGAGFTESGLEPVPSGNEVSEAPLSSDNAIFEEESGASPSFGENILPENPNPAFEEDTIFGNTNPNNSTLSQPSGSKIKLNTKIPLPTMAPAPVKPAAPTPVKARDLF